ncbi:ABC transporter ATP-binding protein [Candidatus Saccharibacteria bacterium]|nr:ABC transporter ATP-binding protein [Candidatus Saccharibacteria bacterium]
MLCHIAGTAIIKIMIEINNVSKRFGAKTILEDVSLIISDGEKISITGQTGCGKSTLLNIISGLDSPDSGTVKIDNEYISNLAQNQRAKIRADKIGFVFQSFYLQRHLTVLENVKIPSFVNKKCSEIEYDKRARLLLELVGLRDRVDSMPYILSGGEMQRVAIARALVNLPKYIFADEPTGNLDRNAAQAVINLLLELQSRFGCTLIIVTHDPAIAGQMSRHISMAEGRLTDEN